MINRITPDDIKSLPGKDYVLGYGSNLRGRHGAGAAKFAAAQCGATEGIATGLDNNSYGIPTKDERIRTMPLSEIQPYIDQYIADAKRFTHLTFWTTKVGCGLAGYTVEQIAPMFKEAVGVKNICLPREFWDVINSSDEDTKE